MKRNAFFSGVLILAALGDTLPAYGLTLDAALERLYTQNPALLAAEQRVERARETMKQQRSGFLPTLDATASLSEQKLDTGTATVTTQPLSYGLTAQQTLFAGGEVLYGYRTAEVSLQAEQQNFNATRLDLARQLVRAYLNVLQNKQIVYQFENQVRVLSGEYTAAQTRQEAGDLTKTDVVQAKARLSTAKAELAAVRQQHAVALNELEELIGSIEDETSWPKLTLQLPQTVEEVEAEVLTNHPAVIAALNTLKAARYDIKSARSGHFPKITADASFVRNENASFSIGGSGADYDASTVSLNLSLPLFRGGATLSGVRGAVAERKVAEQNYDAVRREVKRQLVDAFYGYQAAVAQREALEESLSAAKDAVTGVEEEYKYGQRSTLELLDAQQERLDAEVALTRARTDELTQAAALWLAMGRELTPEMVAK